MFNKPGLGSGATQVAGQIGPHTGDSFVNVISE